MAKTRTDFPTEPKPTWVDDGQSIVFLIDASTKMERKLLESWARHHAEQHEFLTLPPSRRRRRPTADIAIAERLQADDDPLLVPLRLAWFPPERQGRRSVTLLDLLKLGDPRDPGPIRQYIILSRAPDRSQIIVGEPGRASDLEWAHRENRESKTLSEFVAHRAWLALERAERKLRGNRYKVPRFVVDDLTNRQEFREGIGKIIANERRRPEEVIRKARYYVREIAASHSPFVIDLIANAIHWLYRQGYRSIDYSPDEIEKLARIGEEHPLVFLPSHKSQLDRLILQYILWENDLPPNHTAGGINLNFFPLGQLVRRTGVFFIRRSFKDNELYKLVLRSYVEYLIEKRFSLEWYLEGGRSRSGKLLPPRFGMLNYVTEAYDNKKSEDIVLIPTAIAYDQIFDVSEYAAEQKGGTKEAESVMWVVRAFRRLRRRYGNIHVRFGEPISMAQEYPPAATPSDRQLNVQKLAFKTLRGVNQVTPITPTSIVTMALLANEQRAMTVEEIREELKGLVSYILRRRLPITEKVRFDGTGQVLEVLDRLREHGIVTRFDAGREPVYRIQEEQQLAASYYRNTIVHHFINGAIAELALLKAAESETAAEEAFWEETMGLRDLLKFEFFFSEKETFIEEISEELERFRADWKDVFAQGPAAIKDLVSKLRPLRAHWTLRPFLEAYLVVGDVLEMHPHENPINEKQFLATCLGLGKQYQLQGRIATEESISQVLFKSALRLAENRALDRTGLQVVASRHQFASEIRDVLRRIDMVRAFAVGQHVGL